MTTKDEQREIKWKLENSSRLKYTLLRKYEKAITRVNEGQADQNGRPLGGVMEVTRVSQNDGRNSEGSTAEWRFMSPL